jgi:Ca2+-binding EF-hand superfamily protein
MDVQGFLERVEPIEPKTTQVDDLLFRLRAHLQSRHLSMWKHFISFDRERSGVVSVAQLISTFSAIDFHPTTNELNAVAQRYGTGRMVRYAYLCNAVKPKPDISVTRSAEPVEKEEPTALVLRLLQRVFQNASRFGVNVKQEFQSADARKRAFLAARVFQGVLDSLPVKISHPDVTVTRKTYFTPGTEMVCYGEFCDDLEKYGNSPQPVAAPAPP